MFGKSEKTGKIQRFVGHSSQEEQNMGATMKLVHTKKRKEKENKGNWYRKYFL
jgi:hypothetical protein